MKYAWLMLVGGLAPPPLAAGPGQPGQMDEVIVSGHAVNLVGDALTASEGVVGQAELALRPLLRTGEVLEAVPGLVATQHSGTGKANQYFLRGFNLDHGTDFATWFGPMPVNLRTHGHGQGYTDLNFLIPELVSRIAYHKGPYHAADGDFASAGSARIEPLDQVQGGRVEIGVGGNGFQRLVGMDSVAAGAGNLLGAVPSRYDGPWTDVHEDLDKKNALLRWSRPMGNGELALMALAYDGSWNSADQVPQRAVDSGLIDELGSIDRGVGGESSRSSLSVEWHDAAWRASVYAIRSDLDLWSNFTYFLDDPAHGDQFEQVDERVLGGGELAWRHGSTLGALRVNNELGLQWRIDDIADVALYKTEARRRLGAVRRDAVDEASLALYWHDEIHWTERLRSTLGVRWDRYDFDVDDRAGVNVHGVDLAPNSGTAQDDIASARGSLGYRIGGNWEIYAAAGQGFHSNDARGTTARIDPIDGNPVSRVDPLVRTRGAETGIRVFSGDRLNASVALWWLELESELLFVGDAGNTEASRASDRHGVETTVYYRLAPQWSVDLEYAWTDAAFSERDPTDPMLGDRIPGALDSVASLGLTLSPWHGWFGSLRWRYFGPRALEENGAVESDASSVLNLRTGFERGRMRLTLDVLNLLDSDDHDIDYYYASRLAGEAEPVADVHYHVMEPGSARIQLAWAL